MKLREKLFLIGVLPIVVLVIGVTLITDNRVRNIVKIEVYEALQANTLSLRDTISMLGEGDFTEKDGKIYKGDTSIEIAQDLLDEVCTETGIVMTVTYGKQRDLTSLRKPDGSYYVGTDISDKVADVVINKGENYSQDNLIINGEEYYAYYIPYYNSGSDNPVGVVFAGKSAANVSKEIKNTIFTIIIVAGIIFLLAALDIFVMVNRINKAIQASVLVAEEVGNGNLKVSVPEKCKNRKDEIGTLCKAIEYLTNSLHEMVSSMKVEANSLFESSNRLNRSVQDTKNVTSQVEQAVFEVAEGATSQADETQKATENVILMGELVTEANEQVKQIYNNAEQMRHMSDEAGRIFGDLQKSSEKSDQAIDMIYNQVMTTNASVAKIQEATNIITAIADETNLLSLNASIEAARAGEAGRGFAIVAAQIQTLADQSNESTQIISEIVDMLIRESEQTVDKMNEVKSIISDQNRSMEQTNSIFDNVMGGIDHSIAGVNAIADKMKQLDDARENVVDVVQNLTAIAEENAASTQETSASVAEVTDIISGVADAANDLKKISDDLDEQISRFQTDDEDTIQETITNDENSIIEEE